MGLLGRQPVIALFTAVEAAGLVVWLALVRGVADFQVAAFGTTVAGEPLGLGVLFVALLVEHVLTDATVNGPRLGSHSPSTVLFTLTETALWAVWLVVAETVGGLVGVGAAGVLLAVLLVPQHTVEDNAIRGNGLFSQLIDTGTVSFSVVESFAATLWLAFVFEPALLDALGLVVDLHPMLVGAAALVAFLFVEHNLGVRFARRPRERAAERGRPAVAE